MKKQNKSFCILNVPMKNQSLSTEEIMYILSSCRNAFNLGNDQFFTSTCTMQILVISLDHQ